jgi:hypothetical protein
MTSQEATPVLDEEKKLRDFIRLLEEEMKLLFNFRSLTRQEQFSAEKAFVLVLNDPISKNAPKRRAQVFLRAIIRRSTGLFLLCGIATNQTIQGTIYTSDLIVLWTWWDGVNKPPALPELVNFFSPRFAEFDKQTDTRETETGTQETDTREMDTRALAKYLKECQTILERHHLTTDVPSLLLSLLNPSNPKERSSQPSPIRSSCP